MMFMENGFDLVFEGDYVRVEVDGDKDFDLTKSIWSSIGKLCAETRCYKVLGVANSTKATGVQESMEHFDLFQQLEITPEYQIAWVEKNPDVFRALYFAETYFRNRHYDVRLFRNVVKARTWLLGETAA